MWLALDHQSKGLGTGGMNGSNGRVLSGKHEAQISNPSTTKTSQTNKQKHPSFKVKI
jgi:hypothetical protein